MNVIGLHDRRALRVKEASAYCGMGRTKLFALISSGQLESVKVGGTRLVLKASLDRLLTSDDRPLAA